MLSKFRLDIIIPVLIAVVLTYFLTLQFTPVKTIEKITYKEKVVTVKDTVIITKQTTYKKSFVNVPNISTSLTAGLYFATLDISETDSVVSIVKTFPAVDSLNIEFFAALTSKEIYITDSVFVDLPREIIKIEYKDPPFYEKPLFTIPGGVALGVILAKFLIK